MGVDDFFFFFKQKTAYEIRLSLVGSEMCIRDRTTGVSNPVRSPRFRSSASVTAQRPAFAIGVLPDIYTFHRYTGNSSLPYRTQAHP